MLGAPMSKEPRKRILKTVVDQQRAVVFGDAASSGRMRSPTSSAPYSDPTRHAGTAEAQ